MNQDKICRVTIIGAGFAGKSLAAEFKNRIPDSELVAFWDDDENKIGQDIEGIPVFGPISDIKNSGMDLDEAIIAIPSATKGQLLFIYQTLQDFGIQKIRILPAISQIVDGEAHLVMTREIDPQDLLGRNPVRIPLKQSLKYLAGKRVLITGAGGSIGSELARQLLSGGAQRLYLFGHGENSIYQIDKELRMLQSGGVGEKATIVPVIGDMRDEPFMEFLLGRLKADVIFHTAAHKHVPMTEANPVEACVNNIFGTRHLVRAAKKAGVKKFVLISTDKAVEPNSVYGVTKKICEDIVLDAGTSGSPQQFMVVRFGNVLGSRGSIIPLFREQIQSGGPVTITDKRASRYFMTIPEAASLVLQTAGVGISGNLYLLDMGEPVVIEDLARQIIRFYGKEPEKDIPIHYIGLRPGERLEENLYSPEEEEPVPTAFARINKLVKKSEKTDSEKLKDFLEELRSVCFYTQEKPKAYRNRRELRRILQAWCPTLETKEEPEY